MSYTWIQQSKFPSRTARTIERTEYLSPLRQVVEDAIRDYYSNDPRGEQVTLACLAAVGKERVERLACDTQKSLDTIKQDLGLFVAIVLTDICGAEHVETYREEKSMKNAPRVCPPRWTDLADWVSKYTPHRLSNDAQTLLPGLPITLIRGIYEMAPGKEIARGKFASLESSSALAANTFGLFLERPRDLPSLPGTETLAWPAGSVTLEASMRFPWRGGRHPCLDVRIDLDDALIGVESKRFEPFRGKSEPEWSDAYWRNVWGAAMRRYESVRDGLRSGSFNFNFLDAAQLVKHGFGLRTEVHRQRLPCVKRPVLYYLYAEPVVWPDGRPVLAKQRIEHEQEVARFASLVAGDEVDFISCSYSQLLARWGAVGSPAVTAHAQAVINRFLS